MTKKSGIIMFYRVVADIIVIVHFLWILFMLIGVGFTVWAFLGVYVFRACGGWCERFFDWAGFRVLHLCGIVYVGLLATMGKYCPLTGWENALRSRYDGELVYPGSFIVYYIERFVYPRVNPMILIWVTGAVGVFTLAMFIVRPPARIKQIFSKNGSDKKNA